MNFKRIFYEGWIGKWKKMKCLRMQAKAPQIQLSHLLPQEMRVAQQLQWQSDSFQEPLQQIPHKVPLERLQLVLHEPPTHGNSHPSQTLELCTQPHQFHSKQSSQTSTTSRKQIQSRQTLAPSLTLGTSIKGNCQKRRRHWRAYRVGRRIIKPTFTKCRLANKSQSSISTR